MQIFLQNLLYWSSECISIRPWQRNRRFHFLLIEATYIDLGPTPAVITTVVGNARWEEQLASNVGPLRKTAIFTRSNTAPVVSSDHERENVNTYKSKQQKHFRNAEPKGQSRCVIYYHVAGRDTRTFHRGFNIRNKPAIPAVTQCELRRTIITDISEIMEINCGQKAWKLNVAIRDAGLRRLCPQYVSTQALRNETPTRTENSFALRTRGSKQHTPVSTLSRSYSTWPMFFECVSVCVCMCVWVIQNTSKRPTQFHISC